MITLKKPVRFEWDKGNQEKNYKKHKVVITEAEEVFFDKNRKILKDILHSKKEDRYLIIGETKQKRILFIAFTLRKNQIRIVSARDLNKKKERRLYEKTT
ncbi:MAG: BrnT family toxin [Patescibacteria group bacterium]